MNAWLAFASGLVFGGGLLLSGMTDPGRVLGFLDVAGAWDPTLVFVMGGAVPAYAIARRRGRTFGGVPISLPRRWPPDVGLVAGAALFGLGWGAAGICPGPALVLFGQDGAPAACFVAAIAFGAALVDLFRSPNFWRIRRSVWRAKP